MTEAVQKPMDGPLTGLTVVDAGMLFAGPLVCTLLSDLGATVIKVEHPEGDEVRRIGQFKNKESLWWRVTSRNKLLAAVNMKTPEGIAIVRRLVEKADVLVENFRPGRLAEWGIDYETVSKVNPKLVLLHVSGYGQNGPYSGRPGMGTLAESFSGFAETIGEPGGPPSLPMFPIADGVAAMVGAYAVLAALHARHDTGKGDEIDLSLYEPLLSLMGSMVIDYDQIGLVARRRGNRSTWSVPRNAYKTKDDKWVAVSSAANSIAKRMFRAIDRPDLADDPDLATNPQRVKRIEECDGAIADWIKSHTQKEVLDRFLKFEVVAGPICDVQQLFDDPHVDARGTLVTLADPALGKVRMQNVVPRFKNAPGRVRWPGKRDVGADTAAVLTDLGYSPEEVAQLQDKGVVHLAEENADSQPETASV
ncbi:MAG: CoA transferase [Xanthobacteraceae bacterium]|nr:CoA transferase [Xanthobacteraceae bacterium]